MPLTCSYCHVGVLRRDCHRNRYGEMICHACHAKGIRFTWGKRAWYKTRNALFYVGIALPVTALGILFVWLLYVVMLD